MHYYAKGAPVVPLFLRVTLGSLVDSIVERIPTDSYDDYGVRTPFLNDSSPETIVAECFPFCTGEPRTDAVYVLECLKNSSYQRAAVRYLGQTNAPWEDDIGNAERLIYVGVTVDLLRRLNEHLNSVGRKGAHFTTVFRPTRLLDVSWWPSYDVAQRAEVRIAERLRERFSSDLVYQS